MADIGASGLTYVIQAQGLTHNGKKQVVAKITTAAGEYPTGGLPLTGGKLGCPNVIESLKILEENASGLHTYKWDKSAGKIKVFVEDAGGILAEHANAAFTSPDELIVEVIGW